MGKYSAECSSDSITYFPLRDPAILGACFLLLFSLLGFGAAAVLAFARGWAEGKTGIMVFLLATGIVFLALIPFVWKLGYTQIQIGIRDVSVTNVLAHREETVLWQDVTAIELRHGFHGICAFWLFTDQPAPGCSSGKRTVKIPVGEIPSQKLESYFPPNIPVRYDRY